MARLNALVRRAAGHATPVMRFGPVTLDTAGRVVTLGEKPVKLTSYEYRTLEYLILNAGKTISKT